MPLRVASSFGLVLACLVWTSASSLNELGERRFHGSVNDPGIRYATAPLANPIDTLNRRLDAGTARLRYDGRSGYLRSALEAIGLPVESQLLVFSNASLQGHHINQTNPRAIFFKDDVQLGWVRDADLIEVAAQDATLGTVFYTLRQQPMEAPRFTRAMVCLGCHMTRGTLDVPGLVLFSTTPLSTGAFGAASYMDLSMPVRERFGGWFVTGSVLPSDHSGNAVPAFANRPATLRSTTGLYDTDGYLSSESDVAALMVFMHQVQTVNLMIRASWEARATDPDRFSGEPPGPGDDTRRSAALREAARDLVDSLLFIDEVRLESQVRGSAAFQARFETNGPRDRQGRSLRQLDLTRRLMQYPCSYLIYSPMFDAMPPSMKALVYERMWQVLSGAEESRRYRNALTLADRQAIVEILRDTVPDLPSYFEPVTSEPFTRVS